MERLTPDRESRKNTSHPTTTRTSASCVKDEWAKHDWSRFVPRIRELHSCSFPRKSSIGYKKSWTTVCDAIIPITSNIYLTECVTIQQIFLTGINLNIIFNITFCKLGICNTKQINLGSQTDLFILRFINRLSCKKNYISSIL